MKNSPPRLPGRPDDPVGFSLVEVLAAVSIIGIITFLAIPNIIRMKQDGEENLARARAASLNMAMASYVQAVGGTTAQSNWSSAGSDDARYLLIRSYIAFAETNRTSYTLSGYTNDLPDSIFPLTNKTILTGPNGAISY